MELFAGDKKSFSTFTNIISESVVSVENLLCIDVTLYSLKFQSGKIEWYFDNSLNDNTNVNYNSYRYSILKKFNLVFKLSKETYNQLKNCSDGTNNILFTHLTFEICGQEFTIGNQEINSIFLLENKDKKEKEEEEKEKEKEYCLFMSNYRNTNFLSTEVTNSNFFDTVLFSGPDNKFIESVNVKIFDVYGNEIDLVNKESSEQLKGFIQLQLSKKRS